MQNYKNTFYNEFDTKTLEPRSTKDFRTPFQIDRDRIIYSSAFRRLQSKTQVFLSGEYDFYRTRLTHTLEVAQIARSITQFLIVTSPELKEDFFIDPDLVEGVALAHDLGHPPFGHTGEKILHYLMKGDPGGFEGNAQTLRIVTELIYSEKDGRKGMAPSRAFLDGIIKYKILYSEKEESTTKYLYNEQKKYLSFVYDTSGGDLPPLEKRTKSIECQIMDWADNTAYSINDLIDGYKAGFISAKKLEEWGAENDSRLTREEKDILEILISKLQEEEEFEKFMSRQIGAFIRSVELIPVENEFNKLSNRYSYKLNINPSIEKTYKLYSNIAVDLIFSHPAIQQLEFKGKKIIKRIFEALVEEYTMSKKPHVLLPPKIHKKIIELPDRIQKYRLICDHIAGMTDAYVMKTYKKLFDPDFGSIVDIID